MKEKGLPPTPRMAAWEVKKQWREVGSKQKSLCLSNWAGILGPWRGPNPRLWKWGERSPVPGVKVTSTDRTVTEVKLL